jgi:hypothetical protein
MFHDFFSLIAVHGVRSSTLFRRKRRGKVLDVVSTAIPGGVAAGNARHKARRLFAVALNADVILSLASFPN